MKSRVSGVNVLTRILFKVLQEMRMHTEMRFFFFYPFNLIFFCQLFCQAVQVNPNAEEKRSLEFISVIISTECIPVGLEECKLLVAYMHFCRYGHTVCQKTFLFAKKNTVVFLRPLVVSVPYIFASPGEFEAVSGRKRRRPIPLRGGESEGKRQRQDLTAGVAGQRCLQVPHLQLCPDPVRVAVKAGNQPHSNVY